MAEPKGNGCGCSDCNCDNGAAKADTEDVRAAYGKAVASAAIKEMNSKAAKETLPLVDEAEVTAFINACVDADEDVVDVVQHIARREGLDLAADRAPNDSDKSRLWSFLTAVLKTATVELAKAVVQMLMSGDIDWREMLGMVSRSGEEQRRSASKVAEHKPDRAHGRCYVLRRNGCATLGYAFTW